MTHPQDTTSEVVARLKPSAVVDHVPGLAVSASRSAGDNELAERLNEWIDLNNALKSEALALIAALTKRVGELEGALTPSADTKADYIGEFNFPLAYTDDDGNHATTSISVPWTTIKEIMAAIAARAARRLTGGEADGKPS